MEKLKSIYASAYSSTITIAIVLGLTLGAELSASFKVWLTGFTGHHWITKSWISIIVFILFFIIFKTIKKSTTETQTRTALNLLQISIILGFVTILGFYIYEFLIH